MSQRSKMLIVAHDQLKKMIGPTTDKRWLQVLKLAESGKLDQAALLTSQLIDESDISPVAPKDTASVEDIILSEVGSSINRVIVELVVATLMNVATVSMASSRAINDMTAKGADLGIYMAAYNAASGYLQRGKTVEDYRLAEKYFLQAIAEAKTPNEKAACYVNYCPIVRDGLISGKPDYVGGIEIYEKAAELGLLTGMFNAANVAFWIYREGDKSFANRAAKWLAKLIKSVDSGLPRLDMDDPFSVAHLYNAALLQLAEYHIKGDIDDADHEYGLSLLGLHNPKEGNTQSMVDWLTGVALSVRLSKLDKPACNTPGHNWAFVLSGLGWKLGDVEVHPGGYLEYFKILNIDAEVHMVVIDAQFDPAGVSETLKAIQQEMSGLGISKFFLVSKYAVFKESEGYVFTPLVYSNNGNKFLVSMGMRTSPSQLLKNVQAKVRFDDRRFSATSCAISIAVNHLNSGKACNEGFNFQSRWMGVVGWCMPIPNGEPHLTILEN